MSYRTDTFRIAMAGPADLTGLTGLIDAGALDPRHILAILVKTIPLIFSDPRAY